MMPNPQLDLHGVRHHEVSNVVARFLERWLNSGVFVEVIVGNSDPMLFEAVKVIQQYGLNYHTGLPKYQGRILVIMYDEYH